MQTLKRIDDVIAVALLVGLTILTFMQVLFRFVFDFPLDWSEELIRYILVVLIYLSTVITIREDKMIRIELIDLIIKGRVKKVLDLIINISSMAFMIFLTYQTKFLVGNAFSVNQTSPSMGIPLGIMYGIEGILFALMALMFIKQIILNIKKIGKGDK
ncbi:MAG: TRAP transporter small permease [Clostridiaceae bacterium]|nr:TRAP transporter small permease [Clostridiaceae bacterium]